MVAHGQILLDPGGWHGTRPGTIVQPGAEETNSIADIWATLAGRYPGPPTLLEHYPAAESYREEEHVDLAVIEGRHAASPASVTSCPGRLVLNLAPRAA